MRLEAMNETFNERYISQTRAAMLWSVKQKFDPSKSLR